MRFLSTTLLLTLFVSGAFAQKMSFEFQAGVFRDFIPVYNDHFTQESPSLTFLNDSQAVRTNVTQQWTVHETYGKNKIGGQIGTRTVFHLDGRTDLMTGFNLSYRTFRPQYDYRIGTISIQTTSDTIPYNSNFSQYFNPCVYDNEPQDVDFDPTTYYKTWNLSIPLEVRHAFTSKLSVVLGGYMATPVSTEIYNEGLTVEDYFQNGLRHCRYVKVEQTDHTGSKFRKLTYGLTLGGQWSLSRHVYIGLTVQKYMGTIIKPEESSFNFTPKDRTYQALPISAQLQVGYKL